MILNNYFSNFIIVQIYVDDVIFGATNELLCKDFYKLIHNEFEIMGELRFSLGLQIKQSEDVINTNKMKYNNELLKKCQTR